MVTLPLPGRAKSRAFTLIELLVVIAIIAILAAILFPVFAQAKMAAKKAASISNLKQLGTATNVYLADSDDVFPTTYAPQTPGGAYTWNTFIPVPANWPTGLTPQQLDRNQTFIFNNLQPYTKNTGILTCPGTVRNTTTGTNVPANPPVSAPLVSYTYNGLLSSYPSTSVNAPSSLPLFWNGRGKGAIVGAGYVTPFLVCSNPNEPCMYIPAPTTGGVGVCTTNSSGATANGASSSIARTSSSQGFDVFNGGVNFTFTDSSAKYRKIGIGSAGPTDPRRDPFAGYTGPNPTKRYFDSHFCHPYLFRPDYDFSYTDSAYLFNG